MPSYSCILKKHTAWFLNLKRKVTFYRSLYIYIYKGRYAGNRVDQQNKWANEMAQQGELPVDKPNSLSSIPGIQRRLRLINCHLTSTSMLWRTLPYPCKYLNMIDKETTPLNLPSVLFNFMTFSTAQIFPLYEALTLP